MSAADGIAALERSKALVKRARLVAWIVGVLAVLLVGYCAGTHHATAKQTARQLAQLKVEHTTIVDTIRQVERRLVVDTQRVRVASSRADMARAKFDTAGRAVLAVADTSPTVSSALVIPAIHVCDQALAADDTEKIALRAELADMTEDRDAQRSRANNDEAQMKIFKPPLIGWRTGAVVGIAVGAAIANPAGAVRLGKFLIGLVR